MIELGRLPDGAPVTFADFNGLVAVVNALTRLIDGIDARFELLIEYLGVDEPAEIIDLPDLSTYQPEESR